MRLVETLLFDAAMNRIREALRACVELSEPLAQSHGLRAGLLHETRRRPGRDRTCSPAPDLAQPRSASAGMAATHKPMERKPGTVRLTLAHVLLTQWDDVRALYERPHETVPAAQR